MRFHPNTVLRTGLLASLLLLAGCGERQPASSPNIIFITLDTFRADRMEFYGGTGLTPTLDALAKKGTVFAHAISSAGTTYPSHATMFTGLYPRSHGVRSNYARLPDDIPTLAGQLGSAGYDTGAFVSFKNMLFGGNLGKGFAALSDKESDDEPFREGKEAAQLALDWLDSRENKEKPVFLWYHNFDAHSPLRLTDHSKEKLAAIEYEGPWNDGASIQEITGAQEDIIKSEQLQKAIQALYDGEVEVADEAVRFFLEGLEKRGILQNSVLVLVADHGQALGEHGWFGHGATLWESVIHVPLVIVNYRHPRHRVVDTAVGTVDLTPTLLQLVGAEALPSQGRSLIPALLGNPLDAADYIAEIELRKEDTRPEWYDADRLAVYSNGLKLVRTFGEAQVFDLTRDHDAIQPMTIDGTSLEPLYGYMEGLAEDYLQNGKAANLPELDQKNMEQLRSLGYVQ